MLAVVALGFGPTFYWRALSDRAPLPPHVVLHGVVMTFWYLLLLAQALLIDRGRTDLHRKLGVAGIALAAVVFATGLQVHLALPGRLPAERLPDALAFAAAGVAGMLVFAVLIALVVAFRRRPATHKRLVFWAFVVTVGPAFSASRPMGAFLDSLVVPALPFFPSDLLWLAALLVYDWRTLRRIHPATWISFLVLSAFLLFALPWLAGNESFQALVATWAGVAR